MEGKHTMKDNMVYITLSIRVISFVLAGILAGCGSNAALPQTEEAEISAKGPSQEEMQEKRQEASAKTAEQTENAAAKKKRREIPIDFPFTGEQKLTLAVPEEGQNAYELLYYGEDGKLIQQIFCGKLTEPVTFSFDGIAYGSWEDLEIFSAGSDTGLLFIWKDKRFLEKPIGIPRYEECRGTAMLTIREDEEICEKEIFCLNEEKNRTEKVRSYVLHKDTGSLMIWNDIEKRYLFQDTVKLDENGNPLNKEYDDFLLWSDLPLLFDYEAEETVNTWIGKEPKPPEEGEAVEIESYEDMQYHLYGRSGNTAKYESREALLAEFGFENSEPMYRYFDGNDHLELELFMDEDREQVCGFAYINRTNSDLDIVTEIQGFTLCSIPEVEWNGGDPYAFRSVYGTTGEEYENVKDYEEHAEYNAFGKPDYFVVRGRVEGWSAEDMMQDILRIEYIYREDGTLYFRDYYHSHQAFGTTLMGMESFYDEHERVIYEWGYITHGALGYYYIYDDSGGKIADKPDYILMIDYNMGYAVPDMIKCR